MKHYDINLEKHFATNVRHSKIKKMDVILCVTDSQKKTIQKMYPKLKPKIFTVKEFINSEDSTVDITNPWGYDMEAYKTCANELNICTTKIIEKL